MESRNPHNKGPYTGALILSSLAIGLKGDWVKIYNRMKSREEPYPEWYDEATSLQDSTLTIVDGSYPKRLTEISRPPFAIFAIDGKGKPEFPNGRYAYLAPIPKSGECLAYCEYAEKKALEDLLRDGWVVARHVKGLSFSLETADGWHREYGLTPRPIEDAERDPAKVLMADMLLASMCEETVVCGGSAHGPAAMAAAFAANAGRDVFAVPHPVDDGDELCNSLISDGAGAALVGRWSE